APPDDDPAEDEPVAPVDEYFTPEDVGDPLVLTNVSETEQIIYLADEIDTDTQSDGRENDRTCASFDHDLYKEINSAKYLDLKAPEDTEKMNNLTEVSFIDFAKDNLEQVVVNEEYDLLREEIDEAFQSEQQSKAMKVKIITATMTAFTVGFVSYLLRAGSLISSLLSTLPIWRGFDPIAIFVGDRKKKKNQNDNSDTDELKPETLFDGEAE
ncbi:MAG: hypothetical protein HKO68_15035, partial [Desulfobacterales bacterium]|nr:hypothetical protein [Desulfobacterales bacterium]